MESTLPAAPHDRTSRGCLRVLFGATLVVGMGCDTQPGSVTTSGSGSRAVRRLTSEQVHALIERGDDVTVVDVRPPRDYLAGHLPNAVSIPYVRLASSYRLLETAKTVVLYSRTERTSVLASLELTQLGLSDIYVLAGGFAGWRYPIESGDCSQVF